MTVSPVEQPPVEENNDAVVFIVGGEPTHQSRGGVSMCCGLALVVLGVVLLLSTSTVFFWRPAYVPAGFEVSGVEVSFEYGDAGVLAGQVDPMSATYFMYNLSKVEVDWESEQAPALYSCLSSLSPSVFACVSPHRPTMDECIDAHNEMVDSSSSDELELDSAEQFISERILYRTRAVPPCTVALVDWRDSISEFVLCDTDQPVYMALFNLEEDRERAYELSVSYADCHDCNSDEDLCQTMMQYACGMMMSTIGLSLLGVCLVSSFAGALCCCMSRRRRTQVQLYEHVSMEEVM